MNKNYPPLFSGLEIPRGWKELKLDEIILANIHYIDIGGNLHPASGLVGVNYQAYKNTWGKDSIAIKRIEHLDRKESKIPNWQPA